MSADQFYKIIYSAQVGNALFLIAASLVAIAYMMAYRLNSKKTSKRA